ncbi:MAG: hypothetical protein PGN16_04345 [Sphingomonas phyllosphaerae]|uniref:hypothetical protein n=1 Tax=Sphingomonas phyllosphaerae TaxID=257003 RepID=UPI002FF791BB
MHHNRITAGEPLTSAELAQEVEQAGARQRENFRRFNQPLTRAQCDDLAAGSAMRIGALYSSTDKQISDALWQMFGGAK